MTFPLAGPDFRAQQPQRLRHEPGAEMRENHVLATVRGSVVERYGETLVCERMVEIHARASPGAREVRDLVRRQLPAATVLRGQGESLQRQLPAEFQAGVHDVLDRLRRDPEFLLGCQ